MKQREQAIQKAGEYLKENPKLIFLFDGTIPGVQKQAKSILSDFLLKMQGEHEQGSGLSAEAYFHEFWHNPKNLTSSNMLIDSVKFAEAYHQQASASQMAKVAKTFDDYREAHEKTLESLKARIEELEYISSLILQDNYESGDEFEIRPAYRDRIEQLLNKE